MPAKSGSFEPALRIALSELLFMPEQADHSSIFLGVEAVKQDRRARHLAKLANGILRRVQRDKADFTSQSDETLFPDRLLVRWQKFYGIAATEKFAEALLQGASLDLTMANDNEELIKALGGTKIFADTIRIDLRDKPVAGMDGYKEGKWWVQDVAATLPARLMALKPGSKILDMCAAPGGKMAQLLKQNYQVTGLDIDEARLERTKENLARLNYSARLELADATKYEPESLFDGVLLDAPCSATGTFRRHPELIWHRTQNDIAGRVKLQRELLHSAIKFIKPGGILVFVTCSLEKEESEEQAIWISKTFPKMIDFPVDPQELAEFHYLVDENGWVRTLPGMKVPGEAEGTMDGFFVARFKHT